MPNSPEIKIETSAKLPRGVDAVAVFVHSWTGKGGPENLPTDYAAVINELATANLVTGKAGSVVSQLLTAGPVKRLIVVGVGDAANATAETFRAAGAALVRAVKKARIGSLAVLNAADPGAVATGILLGAFDYTDYKGTATKKDAPPSTITITFLGETSATEKTAIDRAVIVAEAQNFARTIASRPGNDINPPSLAKVAQRLAKEVGLGVQVLDEREMARLGMGGMLGVGAGSPTAPPRMIALEYFGNTPKRVIKSKATGKNATASKSLVTDKTAAQPPTLLVVGKAITFDTGGVSIKAAAGMQKMIFDKCGGMAVLGLMRAVARLKLPVNVVGILASAENHISDTAYRPGDILKMYNGVTVEITNTDAEGRLVLGDALAWGIETYKPAAVVDLATLTGGVIVALGKTMAGIMSNDDAIVAELEAASKLSGEKMWRLPIGDDQRDLLKSDPADIVNSGPREAHPLQGGAFLSYFVPRDGSIPWAHIDIAGVVDTERELPFYAKGATGWGVRTLVEWVQGRAAGVVGNPLANQFTPPPVGG